MTTAAAYVKPRSLAVLVLLLPLLAAGCSGMKSSQPPATIYMVHAAGCTAAPVLSKGVLSIPEPEMPAGFDTERIALYLAGGRRLDYFAGAAWPDHLGKMLQQVILQTPCDIATATPDTANAATATLYVKVNDFEPVYAGGPKATPVLKVSMRFRLTSGDRELPLADFTVQQTGDAPANTLTGVTQGLETLSQAVLAQAFAQLEPRLGVLQRRHHTTAGQSNPGALAH